MRSLDPLGLDLARRPVEDRVPLELDLNADRLLWALENYDSVAVQGLVVASAQRLHVPVQTPLPVRARRKSHPAGACTPRKTAERIRGF